MIHDENPFAEDLAQRDPVRRFRGRLSSGVTIVTSGDAESRTGLTVSSLLVVEGNPGIVQMVVGPTSDLWDVVAVTDRFVIHICTSEQMGLSEVFAGLRPSPGGLFANLEFFESEWGPVIAGFANRAYCTATERAEAGYSGVITGHIDKVDVGDLRDPVVYFRGRYRELS